jgi:ferredoxin
MPSHGVVRGKSGTSSVRFVSNHPNSRAGPDVLRGCFVVQIRLFPSGENLELAPGERLIDALDDRELVILPTACRGAHCGTCLVRIVGDGACAVEAGADERQTLASINADRDERLGCQLVVTGQGELTLEVR